MNILLMTATADEVQLALCVAGFGAESVLEGRVAQAGEKVGVTLTDAFGEPIQHTPCETLEDGVIQVLDWLAARNMRVDILAHRIFLHGGAEDTIRLTEDTFALMRAYPACAKAVSHMERLAAHSPACPQVLHIASHPQSVEKAIQSLLSSGSMTPPVGCHKVRVRCESCGHG